MVRALCACLSMLATIFILSTPAEAARPTNGCPNGFDVGLLTFAEGAELLLAEDVPATRAQILARFAAQDANGDQRLCFKDLPNTEGIASFVFQRVDNRVP